MILDQRLIRIINTMCVDAGTPRALSVKLLIENEEWVQLFSLKVDPSDYLDAHSYFVDVQISDFLRKLNAEIVGVDLEVAARESFKTCETLNKKTNDRLSRWINSGPFCGPSDLRIQDMVSWIRKRARDILGKLPSELSLFFGPGATFQDVGRFVTIPNKIESRPTLTPSAQCLTQFFWESAWGRSVLTAGSSPSCVRGNRFTTVPKDALKRRGICIEPSLNVGFQLCVGRALRRSLHGVGINLRDGQQIHRDLARCASRDGKYATIDLSNASDTMAYNLVRLFLPSDWFSLLSCLRSPFTRVDDRWHRLEKFSSMGNGFTFELETLCFLLIIEAVLHFENFDGWATERWVYGDDLIVPTAHAESVLSALTFFGFSPNKRKTFVSGLFRESCGGDYFDGVAVRPHYLKELPNAPEKIISLINGFSRVSREVPEKRTFLHRARLRCLDYLPNTVRRLRGPHSFGDLVIHGDGWSFRETKDKRGFIRAYVPVTRSIPLSRFSPSVVLAAALYGVPSSGPIPRNSVTGYRIKWIPCLERESATG